MSEEAFFQAMKEAAVDGVKKAMTGVYNSPLEKMVNAAINSQEAALRGLLNDAIKSCLDDKQFTEDVKSAVRQSLAKQLVQKFGGELEKQVNALKSDPTTRARIILALEEIVASKAT